MTAPRCEVIGDCTLWLGDAREIIPTLDHVDMIATDPPYGHNNNNNNDLIHRREAALGRGPVPPSAARPITNDGPEANTLVQWLFAQARRLLPPGGICCCCCGGGGGPDPQFARWTLWMDTFLGFKQAVVWDKMGLGMGWHYRRSYELMLVGEKPGGPCKWYGGHATRNLVQLPGIIPTGADHPTPKPVALWSHFLRLHSQPGDLVCDPFMGTGPTGVAAVQLARRFCGIELEARWFDLACRRIEAASKQPDLFLAHARQPAPVQASLFPPAQAVPP